MNETTLMLPAASADPIDRIARVPVPPRIGAWQPVRLIGQGAMTRVYQARPLGRADKPACYAVKVLRAQWEDDRRAVALIEREAAVGRSITHPHLIPVLAHGDTEPPYYVAMPCLEGMTLEELLRATGPPALPVSLWIARQVAEGLEALHAHAFMHADIKPSNVFVAPDGHVTLLDLGYTRTREECRSFGERPVVGTVHYMAPEMMTSALAPDIRSDLYSLGVTLFEMLTGERPFVETDPRAAVVLQRDAVPRRIESLVPGIPHDVAQLVHAMLAREPLRRPQTPTELIDRLTRLEIGVFAHRTPVGHSEAR